MREEPFEVQVGDGALVGCASTGGEPALLLHGGPGIPDYLGPCALELVGLFATLRYTQRGVPPSTIGPPYSIESHMADALAVLDARGVERAWAIGHSWGGHLALHLLVAHPERLLGVIAVDPLGAFDVFEEQGRRMRSGFSAEELARVDEIEELRRVGKVTDDELVERWGLLWPQFFLHEELASAPPKRVGPECSIGTSASIEAHFERRTLELGLPGARLPVLIVHGVESPLTVESAERTAALVPGAVFEPVDDCGHFPWIEQPGSVRRAVERFLEFDKS